MSHKDRNVVTPDDGDVSLINASYVSLEDSSQESENISSSSAYLTSLAMSDDPKVTSQPRQVAGKSTKNTQEEEERNEAQTDKKTDFKMNNDLTLEEITSDYSTMELESIVLDDEGASSTVTCDGTIDQPSQRENVISGSAEFHTNKIHDSVNAEFISLTNDESGSSRNQPNVLEDNEVFEMDTFDDDYSRNIDQTQRFLEKMMIKEQKNTSFRNRWLQKSRMSLHSLVRSPERLIRRLGQKDKSATTTDDTERKIPNLKLRLVRDSGTVRIAERLGNARFTLAGK